MLATFTYSLIMFLPGNNIYTPLPEKLKAIPIFILSCIEKPQYLALVFQLFHKDDHFHNFQGGQQAGIMILGPILKLSSAILKNICT